MEREQCEKKKERLSTSSQVRAVLEGLDDHRIRRTYLGPEATDEQCRSKIVPKSEVLHKGPPPMRSCSNLCRRNETATVVHKAFYEAIVDKRFRSFDAYLSSLDAQQFHEYTRLLPGEFMELQSRVAHRLQHVPTHSAPVSAMHRFALTLRCLGHGISFDAEQSWMSFSPKPSQSQREEHWRRMQSSSAGCGSTLGEYEVWTANTLKFSLLKTVEAPTSTMKRTFPLFFWPSSTEDIE
ncbi:hypothetical protein Q1695_015946 [Nippostrongylus brasiliensis]|nr:hypothetical protein Q1695_015946 [Nippostrongylus brasiliensis]